MPKYSDYKTAFQNIAETNSIEGAAITTISSDLAYSLYNNEMRYLNIIKESNLLTATSLNSMIAHGASRGYSVFRGQNIIYTIKGLNPIQDVSVKKFDLFFEIDGYELRYNQDYEFVRSTSPGSDGTSIDVVLCAKGGYKGVTKRSNKYNTYVPQSNVSQSIVITDSDGVPYDLFDSYEDYLKARNAPPPKPPAVAHKKLIITTYSSFSFSIANPMKTEDDLYSIKYLEYTDFVNLDLRDLKEQIKNFDILKGFAISSNNTFIPREDDVDLLRYKIQNSFKSSFLVKSNDDLEFIVKDYFRGTITGVNIIKDHSGITIYYKTINGTAIPPATVNLFKQYLQTAYYIYDKLTMILSLAKKIDFNVIIYYTDNISVATKYTIDTLASYEQDIGIKFNPFFLLGKLNDSEYISSIDSSKLNTATVQLSNNEYLSFTQNITYINDKTEQ